MQNFGKIKNAFNNLLAESIIKNNAKGKEIFKKYIKAIKESKLLTAQFLIYNNIENKVDVNSLSANIFISENIKFLNNFKSSDIIKENEKLINLSNDIKNKLDKPYDIKISTLHESLTKLIFTVRSPKTINIITEETINVIWYITSNKPKEIIESADLPPSLFSNLVVDKFNEKYSDLDESDRKALKVILDSDVSGKKELYENLTNECICLIDEHVTDASVIVKEKLLKVKDKLLNEKYGFNEENFINAISKLIDLKKELNNVTN